MVRFNAFQCAPRQPHPKSTSENEQPKTIYHSSVLIGFNGRRKSSEGHSEYWSACARQMRVANQRNVKFSLNFQSLSSGRENFFIRNPKEIIRNNPEAPQRSTPK